MNKFIIPIIGVLILAAGIGAFLIFQKPAFPQPLTPPEQSSNQPLNGKCGDGVCDAKEQNNPRLCPKDCKKPKTPINENNQTNEKSEDSPFGIFGPYVMEFR